MISYSPWTLLFLGTLFLVALCVIALLADRGLISHRIIRHPITYVLSLGVFASSWAVDGSELLKDNGFGYIAYFIGPAAAFMLAPFILAPVFKLTQTYQLSSLADLLAFRYRNRWVGTVATYFLLASILPLMAMEMHTLSKTLNALSDTPLASEAVIAALFCFAITIVSILIGIRDTHIRRKQTGLVVTMAVTTTIKIITVLALLFVALFGIFDGPLSIQEWLQQNPAIMNDIHQNVDRRSWYGTVLALFAAVVVMPHMFHMSFSENLNPSALYTASWMLPIMMLIFALSAPFVFWATQYQGAMNASVLANYAHELTTFQFLALVDSSALSLLVYFASLSATAGVFIVLIVAASSMCINHMVLPFYQPSAHRNLYHWLLWVRRCVAATIVFAAFVLYLLIRDGMAFSDIALVAFIAALQFVPGLTGVVFWPQANRIGFIVGLLAGFIIWFIGMELPLLTDIKLNFLIDETISSGEVALMATGVNALLFIIVSLSTRATVAERRATKICTSHRSAWVNRWTLAAKSIEEMQNSLTKALGPRMAQREIDLALHNSGLRHNETRPFALRQLRDQIEANLSGLLGPSVSYDIINQAIPYTDVEEQARQDIYLYEGDIEHYQDKLTGIAADIDGLRRFHRQILHELPIGLCSIDANRDIISWNRSMAATTDILTENALGSAIDGLNEPWRTLLCHAIGHSESNSFQEQLTWQGKPMWFKLHKAAIRSEDLPALEGGVVLVMEDVTSLHLLEAQLSHNERLASVGRLAAGVAHEIGNPVTGIACLAQNLRSETDDQEALDVSNQILEQTQRITRIVNSLVSFSHAGKFNDPGEYASVDVRQCADDAIHLLELKQDEKGCDFRNECTEGHAVTGDAQRLLQVFVNLLSNARDASEPEGLIVVRSESDDHTVRIRFEDQGSGIAADILTKIYEPFVTTKAPTEGTGLGLSMVYSIVEDHYGRIKIDSPWHDGRGTRVTVELPRYQSVNEQ